MGLSGEAVDSSENGVRRLGLGRSSDQSRGLIRWLKDNPQDVVVSGNVAALEPAFPFIPPETLHILHIHDAARAVRKRAMAAAPWADGIACVGRHVERQYAPELDRIGWKGLLTTIHNGADYPPELPRATEGGPIRLLFMGRTDPFKGIYDCVDVLSSLTKRGVPAKLCIVGSGLEDGRIRRLFARRGLSEQVEWTGWLPHADCFAKAAECDILLMPSRRDAFGMVTVEAMAMGCVPIAYDNASGSAEIIENGKNGILVPFCNTKAAAAAIAALWADRTRLSALSAAAAARARNDFNATLMTQRLMEFIIKAAEDAAAHPPSRINALPPEQPESLGAPRGFTRLPAGLRAWIRRTVYASPRLCRLVISR